MDDVTYAIDTLPLISEALYGLAGLAAILLTGGIMWIARRIGVEKLIGEREVRGAVEQLLARATGFGLARLADTNVTTVTTKDQAIAEAATYALKRGRDTLAKLRIDDSDGGRSDLAEMLNARMFDRQIVGPSDPPAP